MDKKIKLNNIYNVDAYNFIKNIDSNSIDLIYVDVPYLYNIGGYGNSKLGFYAGKKKESLKDISNGFDYSILDDFVRVMKKINIFIWCSKLQINYLLNYFSKYSCNYDLLVWCKTNPMPTCNNTFLPDIEYCLYFREKGVKLKDDVRLKHKFYISGLNIKDKISFKHPTIKPFDLVKNHIDLCCPAGGTVLDVFSGSGTTACVCKYLNLNFICCEINKFYFDESIKRLNSFNFNENIFKFSNFEF